MCAPHPEFLRVEIRVFVGGELGQFKSSRQCRSRLILCSFFGCFRPLALRRAADGRDGSLVPRTTGRRDSAPRDDALVRQRQLRRQRRRRRQPVQGPGSKLLQRAAHAAAGSHHPRRSEHPSQEATYVEFQEVLKSLFMPFNKPSRCLVSRSREWRPLQETCLGMCVLSQSRTSARSECEWDKSNY